VKRRMILMLVAVAAFVAVLGGVKAWQIKAAIAGYAAFEPPPEAVTTIVARQERWADSVDAIGTVAAVRGVTVSADLPGVVEKIGFQSGTPVQAGAVLVQLDTSQEQAQLAAAESQRELSRLNLERMRSMLAQHVVAQAEFDRAAAEAKQAEASVGQIRATIARKTIRAPFSGILGIRQVDIGQYLAAGAQIVPLQALNPIYVNFAVPQQEIARMKPGTQVGVALENGAVATSGRVSAIDAVVDQTTRNVQVQATVTNAGTRLRPGMFVQARVALGAGRMAVTLPASAVSYAPYGDSVFIVQMMKNPKGTAYRGVVQRFVKLGPTRGDQVAIVSGVNPGDEVVTSGVFKLRTGAAVTIDNKVQPGNNPRPRPEEG
jgi:membrane fusion protein, multidrug efflux system